MSTFDTMCDWEDGLITDAEALSKCLTYLAVWLPAVRQEEAYEGLCRIVLAMLKKEDDDYELHYRRGVSDKYLVTPRHLPPAVPYTAHYSHSRQAIEVFDWRKTGDFDNAICHPEKVAEWLGETVSGSIV